MTTSTIPWRVPTQEEAELVINPKASYSKQAETLDDFMTGLDAPQAQIKVGREIRYLKGAGTDIYDRPAGTLTPIPRILEKKIGNCEDGSALMAAILSKLGYTVRGVAIVPEDASQTGHMICAYQEPGTNTWGSAGISTTDFFHPSAYESLQDLAEGVTFQNKFNRSKASVFDFPLTKLMHGEGPVGYFAEPLCMVDLMKKYGLAFGEQETLNGTLTAEITPKGWRANWEGLLVLPGIAGVLRDSSVSYNKNARQYQISLASQRTPFDHVNLTLFAGPKGRLKSMQVMGDDARCSGAEHVFYQRDFTKAERRRLQGIIAASLQLTQSPAVMMAHGRMKALREQPVLDAK